MSFLKSRHLTWSGPLKRSCSGRKIFKNKGWFYRLGLKVFSLNLYFFQDFSRLWDFERQWKLLTMQWRTSKTFFASEQHSEVFSPKEYKGRKKELTFQQKSWKRDDWSIHFTMGQKTAKKCQNESGTLISRDYLNNVSLNIFVIFWFLFML